MRSSLIRQLTGLVNRPDVTSFAAGSPNAETFPHEQFTQIYSDLVARDKGKIFQYSVTRGNPELIEAVRDRGQRVKNIVASQEETILASGSQQGMELVSRVLLDPGDAVFVELPNFIGATATFENLRARVVGVRKTESGMDLDDLRAKVRQVRSEGAKPKLIYAIPNFQNPSGHTWSAENRSGLLEVANQEDLLVFEDDAYGELYFSGVAPNDLAPMKPDDGDGRVIHMSTFSKILAPGLRVAWIFGPQEIVRRIELAKETADLCTSTLGQLLILEFLNRGWMEPHVERVRGFYDAKSAAMDRALRNSFTGVARWRKPDGGLFQWVELLGDIDTLKFLHEIIDEHKIAFIPGSPFFVDGSGENTLRLSFSNVSDEKIDAGVGKLGELIRARS